jgi:hypothetical protein
MTMFRLVARAQAEVGHKSCVLQHHPTTSGPLCIKPLPQQPTSEA